MFLWMQIAQRLPLWTLEAHLPEKRAAIDELRQEVPEDAMAMPSNKVHRKKKE